MKINVESQRADHCLHVNVGRWGGLQKNTGTLGDKKMFIIMIVEIISCRWHPQTYQLVHCKYVKFTVCQVYISEVAKNYLDKTNWWIL